MILSIVFEFIWKHQSVFVEKIKLKIQEIEEKRRSNGDSVPIGHWIIDGFPNTKDDWTAMAEADLMPYDLIVVKDQTEKFEHIIEKDRISLRKCVEENALAYLVGIS